MVRLGRFWGAWRLALAATLLALTGVAQAQAPQRVPAPVVARDHDQDAVAHREAADLPGVGHALRVGGDVLRLGGAHGQDDHLRAGLALDLRELPG